MTKAELIEALKDLSDDTVIYVPKEVYTVQKVIFNRR